MSLVACLWPHATSLWTPGSEARVAGGSLVICAENHPDTSLRPLEPLKPLPMASGAPSSAMPPPEYDQQPVSGPELSGDDKTLPGSNDTDDRPHTADSKSIENQETTQREVYENDIALALVPSYSRSHVAEDLEKGPSKVEDVEETDPNVVFWDGDDDPENPYNWPTWRKIVNCALISLLTFITPLASSIFAPGVPDLMREFGSSSPLLASFVVSGIEPSDVINDRGSATIEPAAKQHKAGHCRLILAPQLDVDKHLDEGIEVHVASAQLVGVSVRTEAETGHVDLKNNVTHKAAISSIP
ncbi:hypothetical protein BN1708_005779, partial [Verticillium longisporum]